MKRDNVSLILADDYRVEIKPGGNLNTAVIGPPGGGKTFSVMLPNIVENGGISMVIDDKKGYLFEKNADILRKAGYQVYAFDLVGFSGNVKYNPFHKMKCRDAVHEMVNFLIPNGKNNSADPFWLMSARALPECLMDIGMRVYKNFNLRTFFKLLYQTGAETDSRTGQLKEDGICKLIAVERAEGKNYDSMSRYMSLRETAPETWAGIRSTLIGYMTAFDSDKVFYETDTMTMDFKLLGKEKMAIFLISSDVDDTYYPLIQLMYKDICKQLIRAADQDYKNNDFMLPNHVRFMIDDFASGAQVPGFERVIANCRSRNISFLLGFQSLSQLEELYEKNAQTILDCINYKVYFPSSNLKTEQHLSVILNLPLSDIQRMGQDTVCVESINVAPDFYKRYQTMNHIENWNRKVR